MSIKTINEKLREYTDVNENKFQLYGTPQNIQWRKLYNKITENGLCRFCVISNDGDVVIVQRTCFTGGDFKFSVCEINGLLPYCARPDLYDEELYYRDGGDSFFPSEWDIKYVIINEIEYYNSPFGRSEIPNKHYGVFKVVE